MRVAISGFGRHWKVTCQCGHTEEDFPSMSDAMFAAVEHRRGHRESRTEN